MKLGVYQPGQPDLVIDAPQGTKVLTNDELAKVGKFHVRLVPPGSSPPLPASHRASGRHVSPKEMKLVIYQPGEPEHVIDAPKGTTVVVNDQLETANKFHVRLEPPKDSAPDLEPLRGFRGDLNWVHDREGHAGKPYWPGGYSGLTLDPGFDLGQQSRASLDRYYASILSASERAALHPWIGVKGRDAEAALSDPDVTGIRISDAEAKTLMPLVAQPYWDEIVERFPELQAAATPSAVQTVMLSLAFNRGASNPDFLQLKKPIEKSDWKEVGRMVSQMQRAHNLKGIRARRRLEGDYILQNLT